MFTITKDNVRQKLSQASQMKGYAEGLGEAIEYIEDLNLSCEVLKARKESFLRNSELLVENIEKFMKENPQC